MSGLFDKVQSNAKFQVATHGNFQIELDDRPLVKSLVGALRIHHREKKKFGDFTQQDLKDLAEITQIARCAFCNRDESYAKGALVLGRQLSRTDDGFVYEITPYYTCSGSEKLTGLWRFVFGGRELSDKEIESNKRFWKAFLVPSFLPSELREVLLTSDLADRDEPGDLFCEQQVIDRQEIATGTVSLDSKEHTYNLLQDATPKATETHLLIVPEGAKAHELTSIEQEEIILRASQQAFRLVEGEENYQTQLYVRRYGDLRGMKHPHANIQASNRDYSSFFGKLCLILNLSWPKKLTTKGLQDKILHWQGVVKQAETAFRLESEQ